MELEGCVRRDVKMGIRGTSCMLYIYKHKDTSPKQNDCGCAQYDEHGDHGEHDTRDFADLRTSLQTASLTKRVQGVCEPPGDSRSHVWVVCREVLHIHSSPD